MKLQFIEAGEIVTTHGIKGEMKVLPWVDSPDILCEFDRCRIGGAEYKIETCRVQKSCNLLKVKGIDTVEAAQAMRGKKVELFRQDIADDVIFAAELIGVDVICDGKPLGKITDVLDYPGNSVYVVTGEHEYMIPAVRQFILSTDLGANIMEVAIIEGMRTDEN